MAFLVNSSGLAPMAQAQDFRLPAPGVMVHLSPGFSPAILQGIKVHPDNPFRFDFILDKGDSQLSNDALKDESGKLIKYFLASLTIPEKDLWVNLSPYEKDRIIPNSFGLTEMGRDLLAEDYMLKQITASLIYPEDETGKRFWKRIYEEAAKKFGTTNIPVNTFNKVWIVPEKAVVYENAQAGTAYVIDSRLKVMLEQDYLALNKNKGFNPASKSKPWDQLVAPEVSALGSQVVREIVIPQLTREVNENKNFFQLRQVYNSLILATWYKNKIKDSILSQVYADRNKVAGVSIDDPREKERIYQRYLQAFKKGVYNYIKEEHDQVTQETVPRKYFSGGFTALGLDFAMATTHDSGLLPGRLTQGEKVTVDLGISAAGTSLRFKNGVFVPEPMKESARAQRVADLIERISDIVSGEETVHPALDSDENVYFDVKIKHLADVLPENAKDKSKWLHDMRFLAGESVQSSERNYRTILWFIPEQKRYVSVLIGYPRDEASRLLTELFSILHGDEFDADFTGSLFKRLLPQSDQEWDDWSTIRTEIRSIYREHIYPAAVDAVLSLVEQKISQTSPGAPAKIRMADIFGGDGSFLEMFHKSLQEYVKASGLRMPEMEYWLVERNAKNIKAAAQKLSGAAFHIVKSDLLQESLARIIPPMDIVTSLGGGFNLQVGSREDAQKLSGEVSRTLVKNGHAIVIGYSVPVLKTDEFHGLNALNLSIPINFIVKNHTYQLYVFEKAAESKINESAPNPLGKTSGDAAMIDQLALEGSVNDVNHIIAKFKEHPAYYGDLLIHEIEKIEFKGKNSSVLSYQVGHNGIQGNGQRDFIQMVDSVFSGKAATVNSLLGLLIKYQQVRPYDQRFKLQEQKDTAANNDIFEFPTFKEKADYNLWGYEFYDADQKKLDVPTPQQAQQIVLRFIDASKRELGLVNYEGDDADRLWKEAMAGQELHAMGGMAHWLTALGEVLSDQNGRLKKFLIEDHQLTREAKETIVLKSLVLAKQGMPVPEIVRQVFEDMVPRYKESEAVYGVLGSGGWESEVHINKDVSFNAKGLGLVYRNILGMPIDPVTTIFDFIEYVGRPALSWEVQKEKVEALLQLGFLPLKDSNGQNIYNDLQYNGIVPGFMFDDIQEDRIRQIKQMPFPYERYSRGESIGYVPAESEYIDFVKLLLYVSRDRVLYNREGHDALILRHAVPVFLPNPTYNLLSESGVARLQYPRGDISSLPQSDYTQELHLMQVLHGLMIHYLIRKYNKTVFIEPEGQELNGSLADLFKRFTDGINDIFERHKLGSPKTQLFYLSSDWGVKLGSQKKNTFDTIISYRGTKVEEEVRDLVNKILADADSLLRAAHQQQIRNDAPSAKQPGNPAMTAKNGGIDLTPSNMHVQTQNAGEGIRFHLDGAMVKQLQNAPGFIPVIINMEPMSDLRRFLGLNEAQGRPKIG